MRLAPVLIEGPRAAAGGAGRALTREAALLKRRRGEQTAAVARLAARMTRAYDERLQSRRAELVSAWQLLGAMSYRGVLSRGFALVRDEMQRPLRLAAEVKPGPAARNRIRRRKGRWRGGRTGRSGADPARASGAPADQDRTRTQGRGRCSDFGSAAVRFTP